MSVSRVLLTTEGTYPYATGGVSTWADMLVRGLPDVHFTVFAVVPHPHSRMRYRVPGNVDVVTVPLWGTERLDEYGPVHHARARRPRRPRRAAGDAFMRAFATFVEEVITRSGEPDTEAVGQSLVGIADAAVGSDLVAQFRRQSTWQVLVQALRSHPQLRDAPANDCVDFGRSLFRYLSPLAWPVPAVDVAHASAAAFCALPAIVAKRSCGVPMVLTEHGVYLRERVLELVRDDTLPLRRTMFGLLYSTIVRTAYAHADRIAPVCAYNARWEQALGVPAERVRVIHNGVDQAGFPASGAAGNRRPTLVFVGRIDPLKDVESLITAVAMVRQTVPDVLLRLFGGADDQRYLQRCADAVNRLGLAGAVTFEGPTDDPQAAYAAADVVVMSSVSEGFPYTVLEAMLSGRPVVATAVGGIPEAIGDARLLVPPRQPAALARALGGLLAAPADQRAAVAAQLRRRGEQLFSRDRFLADYRALYGLVAA